MKLKKPTRDYLTKIRKIELDEADDNTLEEMTKTLSSIHNHYRRALRQEKLIESDVPIVIEVCKIFTKAAEEKRKRAMVRAITPK